MTPTELQLQQKLMALQNDHAQALFKIEILKQRLDECWAFHRLFFLAGVLVGVLAALGLWGES